MAERYASLILCAAALLWLALGCSGGGPTVGPPLAPVPTGSWPMFHGTADLAGSAPGGLSETLVLRWKFQTDGPVKGQAAIEGGRVFVGSTDENVYAIDMADGSKVWACKVEGEIEAPPLVRDGTVYVGSLYGPLYAIDAATGTVKWKFETNDQIFGGANCVRSPQGDRDWIIIGSCDGNLYCIDARTGKEVWKVETGNYINGTAAVAEGQVVFGGCDSVIHIVSAADGKEIAAIESEGYFAGSPAVAGGRAYAGNFGGKLVCADLAEKKILWQYGDGESEFYSSPALGPREVVIGCRDNKVHCVGRDDGKPIWTFAARGNVDSSPVICGDKVVVGSADGRLYLLRLADGKQLWSFDVGRSVTATPAVVGGWVVVGGEDGTVYAFSGTR